MFYIGADVSNKKWFVVKLETGNKWDVNLLPNIDELWNEYKDASLILLDIPIGLPSESNERRLCDIEARKLLGAKRGRSVFPTPCRAAVYGEKTNKDLAPGSKLSCQTWGIVPKINEVDKFLCNNLSARSSIREIHPELCFWALNSSKPMEYSKTKEKEKAFLERKKLLLNIYPHTQDIVNAALKCQRKEVGKDDILDALAAAVTAYTGIENLKSIPDKPEFDSHGLPMQMVYRFPAKQG